MTLLTCVPRGARRAAARLTLPVGLLVGLFTWLPAAWAAEPIKVGILHSLSGTMAISETSLKDVALMAIEEINEAVGCWAVRSSRLWLTRPSDWPLFAEKAREVDPTGKSRCCLWLLDLGVAQIGPARL